MEWTIILILSLLIVIQPFVLLYFIRQRKVDTPFELNGNSSSEMDLIIEYEKVDNGLPQKSSQSLILDLEDLDPIVSERTREKKKPRATIGKSDLNFRKQLAKKISNFNSKRIEPMYSLSEWFDFTTNFNDGKYELWVDSSLQNENSTKIEPRNGIRRFFGG